MGYRVDGPRPASTCQGEAVEYSRGCHPSCRLPRSVSTSPSMSSSFTVLGRTVACFCARSCAVPRCLLLVEQLDQIERQVEAKIGAWHCSNPVSQRLEPGRKGREQFQ